MLTTVLEVVAMLTIAFTSIVLGYIMGNTKGKGQGMEIGRISAFEEINKRAA